MAPTTCQSLYRARAARYYLKWLAKSVIEKIFDPATGAVYYFNKYTGTSSWTKPALLGDEDLELTPRSKAQVSCNRWNFPLLSPRTSGSLTTCARLLLCLRRCDVNVRL